MTTTLDRAWHRVRMTWRLGVQRRMNARDPLGRLPWPLWRAFAASNAAALVRAVAHRADPPIRSFLQIGSNDGVHGDPLREPVRRHGWSGLLVEPVPAMFERLTANYADVSGVAFARVAVGERPAREVIWTVTTRPGDPPWAELIASLDRDVVLRHATSLPELESRLTPIEVEVVPLADLVARHDLEHIDLMHVDAEGMDDVILRQIDPAASWAPRFLLFERKHLDRRRYRTLRSWLRHNGYAVASLWPDAFAYRRRPW